MHSSVGGRCTAPQEMGPLGEPSTGITSGSQAPAPMTRGTARLRSVQRGSDSPRTSISLQSSQVNVSDSADTSCGHLGLCRNGASCCRVVGSLPCTDHDGSPCRADWFLLDSRTVRHVAVGLFCCGVSIYLTALAIYMLLLFEMETGITGACILSSGILVLLITVTHALVRAKQVARRGQTQLSHTLYENDSAQHGEAPARHLNDSKNVAGPRPRDQQGAITGKGVFIRASASHLCLFSLLPNACQARSTPLHSLPLRGPCTLVPG
uniref:Transmembrane protein 221 n=1 Tax=Crocodylus porosus TaxID=8502 RepID=A0A7M4FBM6_CROPO